MSASAVLGPPESAQVRVLFCVAGPFQWCGHQDRTQRAATAAARRMKRIRSALSPEEGLVFLTAMGMNLDYLRKTEGAFILAHTFREKRAYRKFYVDSGSPADGRKRSG